MSKPPKTAPRTPRPVPRPNVVIIYADDLGFGDIDCNIEEPGATGQNRRTPAIDALAEAGVRCTQWYSNSPVCSPSRAALLTGKHPGATGVTKILGGARGSAGLSTAHRTLARELRDRGYRTGIFGKWHLGTDPSTSPTAHGFDEFFGFRAGCVDYFSHIFYWGQQDSQTNPVHDLWDGDRETWHNGDYLTELITQRAVDFIERSDQPFFCYVPYSAPHYPMHAPQRYLDRFPDLPPDRRIMAAMVAAMDDGIGRIMAAIDRRGATADTLVVFSSDNGPSAESRNWLDGTEDAYYGGSAGRFRGHKASLFEGGIREPMIITYPRGLPAGTVCDGLGQMIDVAPTVLAAVDRAGTDDDAHGPAAHGSAVHGADVSAMLRADAPSPHERAYWGYENQLAIRSGDWKLLLDAELGSDGPQTDTVFLADVAQDPGERSNRAAEHPELVARLAADLRSWAADAARSGPA